MDLGPLRALATDLNLRTHGVPITVIRPFPDNEPIATRGIWLQQAEDVPGSEWSRREARRVMALRRLDVPTAPRGTIIVAPFSASGPKAAWRVESSEQGTDTGRVDPETVRVLVVADANATVLLPEA